MPSEEPRLAVATPSGDWLRVQDLAGAELTEGADRPGAFPSHVRSEVDTGPVCSAAATTAAGQAAAAPANAGHTTRVAGQADSRGTPAGASHEDWAWAQQAAAMRRAAQQPVDHSRHACERGAPPVGCEQGAPPCGSLTRADVVSSELLSSQVVSSEVMCSEVPSVLPCRGAADGGAAGIIVPETEIGSDGGEERMQLIEEEEEADAEGEAGVEESMVDVEEAEAGTQLAGARGVGEQGGQESPRHSQPSHAGCNGDGSDEENEDDEEEDEEGEIAILPDEDELPWKKAPPPKRSGQPHHAAVSQSLEHVQHPKLPCDCSSNRPTRESPSLPSPHSTPSPSLAPAAAKRTPASPSQSQSQSQSQPVALDELLDGLVRREGAATLSRSPNKAGAVRELLQRSAPKTSSSTTAPTAAAPVAAWRTKSRSVNGVAKLATAAPQRGKRKHTTAQANMCGQVGARAGGARGARGIGGVAGITSEDDIEDDDDVEILLGPPAVQRPSRREPSLRSCPAVTIQPNAPSCRPLRGRSHTRPCAPSHREHLLPFSRVAPGSDPFEFADGPLRSARPRPTTAATHTAASSSSTRSGAAHPASADAQPPSPAPESRRSRSRRAGEAHETGGRSTGRLMGKSTAEAAASSRMTLRSREHAPRWSAAVLSGSRPPPSRGSSLAIAAPSGSAVRPTRRASIGGERRRPLRRRSVLAAPYATCVTGASTRQPRPHPPLVIPRAEPMASVSRPAVCDVLINDCLVPHRS